MAKSATTVLALLLVCASTLHTVVANTIFDQSSGPCAYDLCAFDNICYQNHCLPSSVIPQPAESTSDGPCVNDHCDVGHYCYHPTGQCYPEPNPATAYGPCLPVAAPNDCPPSTVCISGECYPDSGPEPEKPTTNIFVVAAGPCVNELCPNHHICYQNNCIPTKVMPKPDDTTALGPCINAVCPSDHYCYHPTGHCYPEPNPATAQGPCLPVAAPNDCPPNTVCISGECYPDPENVPVSTPAPPSNLFDHSFGPCPYDLCAFDHICYQNQCIPPAYIPEPDESTSNGPCVNDHCDVGHYCYHPTGECYPEPNPATAYGPCLPVAAPNDCPPSTVCISGECYPDSGPEPVKPTTDIFVAAAGPCVNDLCPANHICYQEKCVPTKVMPTPDHSTAVGPCIGGHCQSEHYCYHPAGECYPEPNPATAQGPCIPVASPNDCPPGTVCISGECYPDSNFTA